MSRRNLVLCFDAFGTLFSPKESVAKQYADVACQHGLGRFISSDREVKDFFSRAFYNQLRLHPNYGKASGLGPEKWWSNVINETFLPLTNNTPLPETLAPALLHRFSSKEGYTIADRTLPKLLSDLKTNPNSRFNAITTGIITNSDDRIPLILASLGFDADTRRFGSPPPSSRRDKPAHFDFTCMSYDVDAAKPSAKIFAAAEEMARDVLNERLSKFRGDQEPAISHLPVAAWMETPQLRIHVGDEFENDVMGAVNAGWNAVLVGPCPSGEGLGPEGLEGMVELGDVNGKAAEEVFTVSDELGGRPVALRTDSIQAFLQWMNLGKKCWG
ncbi:hypothetical protein QBC34DRAFT_361356 [Podospora aff. communis PSN243]|uniref:Hydrolase n=1 Tax=Podospora aff. communis PSN243 TaxID=3040156 RepID=A0AAV9G5S6_9PEZI|nr:hypothetical protein QBC34DRAFT_361356 [Podospora aff. communis PSN243]